MTHSDHDGSEAPTVNQFSQPQEATGATPAPLDTSEHPVGGLRERLDILKRALTEQERDTEFQLDLRLKAEDEVERLRAIIARVNDYADQVVRQKRWPMALDIRTITAGSQVVFGPQPTEEPS